MTLGIYTLLAASSVNVFLAVFCKASWKLLYAANICDFVVLEKMFMPVNSLGLLFVGVSLVGMFCRKRKGAMLSVAPVTFTSRLPFIMMMVVGLDAACRNEFFDTLKTAEGTSPAVFVCPIYGVRHHGQALIQPMPCRRKWFSGDCMPTRLHRCFCRHLQ